MGGTGGPSLPWAWQVGGGGHAAATPTRPGQTRCTTPSLRATGLAAVGLALWVDHASRKKGSERHATSAEDLAQLQDSEGRLLQLRELAEVAARAGVEPGSRARVWPYLLRIYDPALTTGEKEAMDRTLSDGYRKLLVHCESLQARHATIRRFSGCSVNQPIGLPFAAPSRAPGRGAAGGSQPGPLHCPGPDRAGPVPGGPADHHLGRGSNKFHRGADGAGGVQERIVRECPGTGGRLQGAGLHPTAGPVGDPGMICAPSAVC